ncbi:ABC transporter ATP-binding protein [Kosakonia sp. BYX6]|uniref:ABC transporter ATP-binding protein n=1 Tax=Kosakonia calanthes TaxID=3139408 RepID=A0ABZ3B7L8_9ENTR
MNSPSHLLLTLIAGQRAGLIAAMLLAALSVISELLPWYLLWQAVQHPENLLELAAWLALALGVKYLLLAIAGWFSHRAAFRVLYDVRMAVARGLTRLPLSQLSTYASGSLRNIVINDVERLEGFIAHHTVDFTAALLSPLVAAAFLFWSDWQMALAALATVPLALLAQKIAMRGMAERVAEYNAATSKLNAAIVEYVRGIPVMKAFCQSSRAFRLLNDSLEQYRALITRFTHSAVPGWSLFTVLLNASIFILLPLGIWRVSHGGLTVAQLILILLLGSGLIQPLLRVTFMASLIREMLAGVARIAVFLQPAASNDDPTPADLRLQVSHVYFGYPGSPILNDLSFTLSPGGFYALVGPSGAGKSTLAWLMAGLLSPDKGEITLGGVAVDRLSDARRAQLLGMVSQEVFIFRGTLAENLRLGCPSASDEQIWQALGVAQAQAFVAALPQGLQTLVGERGVSLSGGERQRIAIARALLAQPTILILDEATAFADALTENAFYLALRKTWPAMTVVAIAHRLFAVQHAEAILLLDNGELVALGDHPALLRDSPLYRDLWHSQFRLQQWHIRDQQQEAAGARA